MRGTKRSDFSGLTVYSLYCGPTLFKFGILQPQSFNSEMGGREMLVLMFNVKRAQK